ncbi:MAG TPA: TonB family protein [Burkholderiales bacterium]|nr:TonB family protein [Burkholderiales bacterium]
MKLGVTALPWGSWPEPLARLDPDSRALAAALSISIVFHAIVLSIHFKLPDALRSITPSQLDVVLVNSKTRARPAQPDALAQSNLDGGGDTDLERRAKSPLPVLQPSERGADLKQEMRRVQEMEARQRQLLSQLQSRKEIASADPAPHAEAKSQVSGADLAESALIIARMEAQIARQIDEYNKRPRKTFVGARAAEVRYALYVEDWRQKIERIGNLNYPESARGKIYGSLRLTVSINSDGTLAAMDLERSSGYKILDAAAQQIVRLAAPYAKFPPDIRKETDILVITRTWHFARGDKVFSD